MIRDAVYGANERSPVLCGVVPGLCAGSIKDIRIR
jgi:hypothetical protein